MHNKNKQTAMLRTRLVMFLFVLSSVHLSSNGQVQDPDSIIISNIVYDFYKWYIESIKDRKYQEFQPKFVEDKKGMTTLDCSNYLQNLERLNFSDSLIIREKNSYKPCINNLAQIQFSVFRSEWTDLDNFEESGCDFSNYYRWIGGLGPIDGISIIKIDFKKLNIATVQIGYFSFGANNSKDSWGSNVVELIKLGKNWKINKILSWI
jgi:hypothetical protein